MKSKRLSPLRKLVRALDFAADAWRGAWAVQALFAAGAGLAVASWLAEGRDAQLLTIGLAVCLVAWAPLFGALHQVQRLYPEERELGIFGLQLGPAEFALWGVAISLGVVAVLLGFVTVAALTVALIVLRRFGEIGLGPFGEVRVAILGAAAVFLGACGFALWLWSRLSLAWGMTVDNKPVALVRSWIASQGRDVKLTVATLLAWTPTVVLGLIVLGLDRLGPSGAARWPWPDAALMGLCAGLVAAFVQAPVLVGVAGGFERRSIESSHQRRAANRSLLSANSL